MGGIPTVKNGWFMTLLYPHYFMIPGGFLIPIELLTFDASPAPALEVGRLSPFRMGYRD